MLVAAAVICLVGVLDDVFELPPLAKFAGQVLAAGIAVALGVKMLWIPLPGQIIALNASASVAITVFFIVLCSNAVNFVDGLDGLATGVVGIGAGAFFAYSYLLTVVEGLTRATTSSLITVAIAGACLGFLPHNFFPARMFMGDSGAMLLGLLLATSTISLTGQIDTFELARRPRRAGPDGAAAGAAAGDPGAAVPGPDLAFIRRTYAGRWWFLPDKQHLHHRLLERGHSQRRAVMLMYVWSALVSFGVIVLGLVRTERQWTVVTAVAVCALVLLLITLGRPVRHKMAARGRVAALTTAGTRRASTPVTLGRCEPRATDCVLPVARASGRSSRSVQPCASATWPTTDHDKDCHADDRGQPTREHRVVRPAGRASTSMRARKLLLGGAVGGLAASLLCLVGFGIGYGGRGLGSAALAAAMVLFFYGVGQCVMVLFADAGARTLLAVSMCSYTTRVVVLGLVLVLYNRNRESWPTLVPMAIFVTTIAVVAGWLAVEIFVFSRLENRRLRHRVRAPVRREIRAVTGATITASVAPAMNGHGERGAGRAAIAEGREVSRHEHRDAGAVLPDRRGCVLRVPGLAR